jgi:hypothetical protein
MYHSLISNRTPFDYRIRVRVRVWNCSTLCDQANSTVDGVGLASPKLDLSRPITGEVLLHYGPRLGIGGER